MNATDETTTLGARLSAARTTCRMSVVDVAGATRLRPELIDALERDDFAPSGGDVYARAHIRAVARVVGEQPAELLTMYDEHRRRTTSAHRWRQRDRTRAGLLPDARQRRRARRWTRRPRVMWTVAVAAVSIIVVAAWLAAYRT